MVMVKAMDPPQRRNQKKGIIYKFDLLYIIYVFSISEPPSWNLIISTPAKKKARMSTGSTPKNALKALDGKGISTAPKGSKSTAKKSATPGASAAAKKRKIEELEKDVRYVKTSLFAFLF
jgi:hypothetical protein